jgi:hypothetical protein
VLPRAPHPQLDDFEYDEGGLRAPIPRCSTGTRDTRITCLTPVLPPGADGRGAGGGAAANAGRGAGREVVLPRSRPAPLAQRAESSRWGITEGIRQGGVGQAEDAWADRPVVIRRLHWRPVPRYPSRTRTRRVYRREAPLARRPGSVDPGRLPAGTDKLAAVPLIAYDPWTSLRNSADAICVPGPADRANARDPSGVG